MTDFTQEFSEAHGASPALVTAAVAVHQAGLKGDREAFVVDLGFLSLQLEKVPAAEAFDAIGKLLSANSLYSDDIARLAVDHTEAGELPESLYRKLLLADVSDLVPAYSDKTDSPTLPTGRELRAEFVTMIKGLSVRPAVEIFEHIEQTGDLKLGHKSKDAIVEAIDAKITHFLGHTQTQDFREPALADRLLHVAEELGDGYTDLGPEAAEKLFDHLSYATRLQVFTDKAEAAFEIPTMGKEVTDFLSRFGKEVEDFYADGKLRPAAHFVKPHSDESGSLGLLVAHVLK